MTISTSANKAVLAGNGTLGAPGTPFTFSFPNGLAQGAQSQALALSYYSILYTTSAGVQSTITIGSGNGQANVTLNAAVSPALWGLGGTIVFQPGGSPPPSGSTVTIIRTVPLTQLVSLQNQAAYGQYASAAEQAMDLLEMEIQQLNELYGRAIVVNAADASSPTPLPPAAQRANLALTFDSLGNPTASALPASGVISSAMAPVVSAASLSAGRTAFGLGNVAVETIGLGLQDNGSGSLQVNVSTPTSDSTSQAVTSSFHLTRRIATGPITYTLPRANTLFSGFEFFVDNQNSGGNVTFAIDSHDNFEGGTSGTSLVVGQGARVRLYTDAAASGIWHQEIVGGCTVIGDAAYTITLGDRVVVTSIAFTVARTWTLPPASSFPAGTPLTIADEGNAVTSTNTLTIQRAGSDTIVGPTKTITSGAFTQPGASITLVSDGSSKWLIQSLRHLPTAQQLTSGSAAIYTPTSNFATHMNARVAGGGGGGGAQATNNGTAGNASSFQVGSTGTAWTANGGSGGHFGSTTGGAGGTGGTNGSTGTLVARVNGQQGGGSTTDYPGIGGGSAFFGGGGPSGPSGSTGGAGGTNTGGGGAGGGTVGTNFGCGGGGGECVEFWAPCVSSTYTVAATAAGGAAGTVAGGVGAAGQIVITEHYR